jgi:hypothetical protein
MRSLNSGRAWLSGFYGREWGVVWWRLRRGWHLGFFLGVFVADSLGAREGVWFWDFKFV